MRLRSSVLTSILAKTRNLILDAMRWRRQISSRPTKKNSLRSTARARRTRDSEVMRSNTWLRNGVALSHVTAHLPASEHLE